MILSTHSCMFHLPNESTLATSLSCNTACQFSNSLNSQNTKRWFQAVISVTICFYFAISSSLFNYQLRRASDITLQIGRQSAKQNHGEIIEMSDSSARGEQMDQTDKWSLDPSAVSPELQQQKTPLNKFQHGSLKAAPGTISLFLLFCQLAMYFWSSYFNAWGFPKSIQWNKPPLNLTNW